MLARSATVTRVRASANVFMTRGYRQAGRRQGSLRLDYCSLQVHICAIDPWPNDWAAASAVTGTHVSDIFPKSTNLGKARGLSRAACTGSD